MAGTGREESTGRGGDLPFSSPPGLNFFPLFRPPPPKKSFFLSPSLLWAVGRAATAATFCPPPPLRSCFSLLFREGEKDLGGQAEYIGERERERGMSKKLACGEKSLGSTCLRKSGDDSCEMSFFLPHHGLIFYFPVMRMRSRVHQQGQKG